MPSKCFASWASPNWTHPPRRRDKNRSCSDHPQNPPPYLLGVTGHNVKHALEDPLTPAEAVPLNRDPKLPELPSVMALSDVKMPQLAQLGDPLSAVQGPPSNGPGGGGGIGSGCFGRAGPKTRPRLWPFSPRKGFRPGPGRPAHPPPLYDPPPPYSPPA